MFNQKWIDAGSDRHLLKDYFNVIHKPLIPANNTIMDIIPPMELHIFIGVINHMLDGVKCKWGGNNLNDFLIKVSFKMRIIIHDY